MSNIKENTKTLDEILEECGISSDTQQESKLVLWNDDFNSFEHVIICLVSFLKFTPELAESTAWNVHLKGKDIVKTGSKDELMPYKKLLEESGLTVSIEE